MNKIIERMSKWGADNVWDNGKIIMNNYCIVSLNEDFEHTYEEPNEFMMQKIREHFDITADYDKTLEFPNAKEIKSAISELCGRKYSTRVAYCFGDNMPTVNARFMFDLIDNLKVEKVMYESIRKPILFIGKYGRAILLPIVGSGDKKGFKIIK